MLKQILTIILLIVVIIIIFIVLFVISGGAITYLLIGLIIFVLLGFIVFLIKQFLLIFNNFAKKLKFEKFSNLNLRYKIGAILFWPLSLFYFFKRRIYSKKGKKILLSLPLSIADEEYHHGSLGDYERLKLIMQGNLSSIISTRWYSFTYTYKIEEDKLIFYEHSSYGEEEREYLKRIEDDLFHVYLFQDHMERH